MATFNRTFSAKNGIDVANTVIVDSNRNLSNIATANVANTFVQNIAVSANANIATANITNGVVTGNANIATANITNAFIAAANANNLVVANNTTLNVANIATANIANTFVKNIAVSANANIATANIVNANISGAANIATLVSPSLTNAHNQANTANTTAQTAFLLATTANTTANLAYDYANTRFSSSGGTITGDTTVTGNLSVTGNLTFSGNTTYVNVSTLNVSDPIIYLAANNETSDLVDIGFVGGANTGGTYGHVGLIRSSTDQKFYLFDKYGPEPTNNKITLTGLSLATLRANIDANSIVLVGNTVATQANLTLAYNQANTANITAQTAITAAATANTTAQTAVAAAATANTNALNAFAAANTAANTTRVSVNNVSTQNAVSLNFNNSSSIVVTMSAGVGGNANISFATTGASAADAFNKANSAANTVRVMANGGSLQQPANGLNFINTASITVSVTANTDGNANIAFTTNANQNITVANIATANIANATVTGTANIATANIANATVTGNLQVKSLNVTTNTITTTSNVQTVLDWFPATELSSAKYFIQANSNTIIHTTELIVVQDGVNAYITEYGTVQTGTSLGTFTADVVSGNTQLLFTAASATPTTIRSIRYGVQK